MQNQLIMEKMQDLTALLKHEVEDLVSVEDQIIEAMPAMIERAKNTTLKKNLRDHLKVTQAQRKRLDEVQKLLNGQEQGGNEKKGFLSNLFGGMTKHECKGMKGIIDEGQRIMAEDMTESVMDAAIIASAQKIEHYEICGYGTARAYARELNNQKVAKLLEQTLNEEYDADQLLTKLALGSVNEKAEGRSPSSNGKSNGAMKKAASANSAGTVKKTATATGSSVKRGATKQKGAKAGTKSSPKKAAASKAGKKVR
jgi:ferritin-like metal-binding protein YciE